MNFCSHERYFVLPREFVCELHALLHQINEWFFPHCSNGSAHFFSKSTLQLERIKFMRGAAIYLNLILIDWWFYSTEKSISLNAICPHIIIQAVAHFTAHFRAHKCCKTLIAVFVTVIACGMPFTHSIP